MLDLATCGAEPCTPTLTGEPVTKGATYVGDVAVVGSAVRVIEVGSGGALSVRSFGREGVGVALSADWVCAIAKTDGLGNPGRFAACGNRDGSTLTDLSVSRAPLPASEIGVCGQRAVALGADGDENGSIDTCLVAFRTRESAFDSSPAQVGNRDLDDQDLAMYLLGPTGIVDDCRSSATDCPGQACELFNSQVGGESVLFLVDEADENFGFTPAQDVCSPGSDVNEDGLCDVSVRRCAVGASLTEGTSFGQAGNVFSDGGFSDGENTVTEAGFCGTSPENVRFGQVCASDLDCLAQQEETCQLGLVVLSALADSDGDEIPDVSDNCPNVPNSDQTNSDVSDPLLADDPFGDACDAFTCGDAIVQDAEACDEGASNGTPASACSATCSVNAISCEVEFKVISTLNPRSKGVTPISVYGSAKPDGTGCLNLDTRTVGGVAPRSIDPNSLRLSATEPTQACPTSGGAPIFDFTPDWFYGLHLYDSNRDGARDLHLVLTTRPIGATASTKKLYLTGRFDDAGGPLGEGCFVAEAPVKISGR